MLQGTFFVFSPSADEKRFGAHGFGSTEARFDGVTVYPTHFSRCKKVLGRFVYHGVFSVLASFGCCFFSPQSFGRTQSSLEFFFSGCSSEYFLCIPWMRFFHHRVLGGHRVHWSFSKACIHAESVQHASRKENSCNSYNSENSVSKKEPASAANERKLPIIPIIGGSATPTLTTPNSGVSAHRDKRYCTPTLRSITSGRMAASMVFDNPNAVR